MSCTSCGEVERLVRRPNWGVHLFRWSKSVVGEPFVWGETDCGSLVRGAVRAMYGETPDAWSKRPYTSERQALRVQVQMKGVSGALRALGATDETVAYAQSGDIVVRPPRQGRETLRAGVVVNGSLVVTSMQRGVCRAPLRVVDPDSTVLRLPFEVV